MIALLPQTIAAFALHALWQVPLLGGAAWIAIRIGRPHVRFAHALWMVTLALCVLAPAASTVAGRSAAIRAQHRTGHVVIRFESLDYTGNLPALQREPLWLRVLHRHFNEQGVTPFAIELSDRSAGILAVLYLLIAAVFTARLVYGWRRSASLVRQADRSPVPPHIAKALRQHSDRLKLTPPTAALSDDIRGPALAGTFRPTLLLPTVAAIRMTPREIDAVLAHELSHLRRHDPLLHAVSSLLLVPVAFHPAALWVAHRIRQTREMACDAEAAQHMGSPARYAHALLRVAERTGSGPARIAGLGLFTSGLGFLGSSLELFGAAGAMEERMETLMHRNSSKGSKTLRATAALSVAAIAVMAAAMVQVQPALASGRASLDATPRLAGADHAREQLQNARQQLDQAAARATTDDERRKIATARELTTVVEQQIAAASGDDHRVIVHLDKLPPLNLNLQALDTQMADLRMQMNSPEFKAQTEAARLQSEEARRLFDSPEYKAQMEEVRRQAVEASQRVNSPEFRAEMEKVRKDMVEARIRMNTPEFRANVQRQIAEANKQIAEAKINHVEMDRVLLQAREAQAEAIQHFRATMPNAPSNDPQTIARMEAPAGVAPPPATDNQTQTPKVPSAVMAGSLQTKANPVYPPEAKEKKIQGAVLLHALIGEDGKIASLQIISSPDKLLSTSAMTAVKQWTYKPYLLNGKPTAVDTTITVTYSLAN